MHDKDATPIEAIDFETLQQPVQQREESSPFLNNKSALWLVFIFLLLCGLIVFMFLPNYVAEKQSLESNDVVTPNTIDTLPIEAPAQEILQEPIIVLSPEEISAFKLQAEELLLQVIEKQKLLESKAVNQWAEQEFSLALILGSDGDEYFRKQDYPQAITSYRDAVTALTALEELIAPTLATQLQKGELALIQSEKDTAIFHFELAKSIEPDNKQALNGLLRANTINELYALLEQGGKLEAANKFSEAQDIYKQATQLDPLSTEAKSALNRVTNRIAEIEFSHLINKGYASLKIRQYGDARNAFAAAQKLFPNSKKPKQGITSVNQAMHKEKLSALMAEAQHFENSEDWGNAVESYQQILALSPNLSSAQQGLKNTQQRQDILIKLNRHINNKLRLSTDKVAMEAKQLISTIATLDNPGKNIQQGANTLEDLILLAKQPVSITIQSDNLTDIVIFKVGKFGTFEQKKLDLKIGKYTVVGSRQGYRDVRKNFTVTTNMSNKVILVRCDEPI
jgi:tetratricopeptide (TPR) repeat protein